MNDKLTNVEFMSIINFCTRKTTFSSKTHNSFNLLQASVENSRPVLEEIIFKLNFMRLFFDIPIEKPQSTMVKLRHFNHCRLGLFLLYVTTRFLENF